MDEVEIQKHIESIERDLVELKKRVQLLSKQQVEMNSRQSQMNRSLEDTNVEAHKAKHGVDNLKTDLAGFMALFEKNQKAIEASQSAIQDLVMAKKIGEESKKVMDEKVTKVLTWMEDFAELATFDGWKTMFVEHRENSKFREGWLSNKALFIGFGGISAAILAAISLAKVVGLYH